MVVSGCCGGGPVQRRLVVLVVVEDDLSSKQQISVTVSSSQCPLAGRGTSSAHFLTEGVVPST